MKHRDAAHPWLFIAILALAAGCSSGATTVSDGSTVDDTGVADTGNMDGAVEHDAGMDSGVPDTGSAGALTYPIVDTAQAFCYGTTTAITCPAPGAAFYGQDGQFVGNQPSYTLSADGLTVLDNVTGLTWQHSPESNGDGALTKADKFTYANAITNCRDLSTAKFGGFDDWRLPTIKELYSLIRFDGTDPSGLSGNDTSGLIPFIDRAFFDFAYGDTGAGERIIDSQYASGTKYVGPENPTEGGKLFGVNFADGRIKGYGLKMQDGSEKTFFVQCVRGNPAYGVNDFVDNGDQTITDRATGLMWSRDDSGAAMEWQAALAWAQTKNTATFLGHDDWRLPNAKELQSIVDYTRAPDTTQSAAIDPVFNATAITNEDGAPDFPWYWASTTHAGYNGMGSGVYVAFGRAGGWQKATPSATCYTLMDVHGAGAQRSDPKTTANLTVIGQKCSGGTAYGLGPQGDALRGANYVRLVRNGATPGELDGGSWPDASIPQDGGQPPLDGGQPPMDGGVGPTPCTTQSDCTAAGACPLDAAKGCKCSPDPQGQKLCIPACSTDTDCPRPPGQTLKCGPNGLCVPG